MPLYPSDGRREDEGDRGVRGMVLTGLAEDCELRWAIIAPRWGISPLASETRRKFGLNEGGRRPELLRDAEGRADCTCACSECGRGDTEGCDGREDGEIDVPETAEICRCKPADAGSRAGDALAGDSTVGGA